MTGIEKMEEWVWINGYEGRYKISSLGNISSYKHGTIRLMQPSKDKHGYYKIHLYLNNKSKNYLVSRLVAIHFIPNPNNLPCVNHINGDKGNNSIHNLEWVSIRDNTIHSFKIGLNRIRYGEESSRAKLNNKTVLEIRKDYADNPIGYTSRLSKKYNTPIATIYKIVSRNSWKHI